LFSTQILNKAKNYFGLADRAGYVIYGTDNLKGYTHKLYLVVYRADFGKTIQKTINQLTQQAEIIMLPIEDFNFLVGNDKCKLFAIKNKGLSEQIVKLLRSGQID